MEKEKSKGEKDNLLSLLKSRLTLAKRFSKKWLEDVKKYLKAYEIDSLDDINSEDLHNKLQIPYIFSTIESALPSMFNSFPSLIIKGRGKNDIDFGQFVSAVWEYIYDKTNFEEKVENVGTMFLITGVGQGGTGWITETEKVDEQVQQPILNSDGTEVVDEMGQPVMQEVTNSYEVPVKDLPIFDYKDYKKIFYSPESEFVIDDIDGKIPYVIEHKKMSHDEIKERYNKKSGEEDTYLNLQDIDSELSLDDKELLKPDLKRVDVYEYQGVLPKKYTNDPNWKPSRTYLVCFTNKEILSEPKQIVKKTIVQVGNYGVPTKFWKFGEPKSLYNLEMDISLGRSTLIDYRDRFATKIWLPTDSETDERGLRSPKKFQIIKGSTPPSYVTPPPMPETVLTGIGQSRQDISMTSAQLDVGRGGDTSAVDTATGQKMFQQAQSERIERKRRKIAKFIQACARNMISEAAQKWDVETFAKITDVDMQDPKQVQQLQDFVERLKKIGDHFDVEIEPETVVSNKAVDGAQSIAMYREMKEDQTVNHDELVKQVIRTGFGKKEVERFISGELTPEQMQKALEILIQGGAIDENTAQIVLQQMQQQGQQVPGNVGRPPSADAATIMKKSMPGTDSNQMTSQADAAYKQQGVAKGPQGL